jgi:hypothetical protein
MHQLQAWTDRGAFKFPNGDDKGGFTMIKEDSNDDRVGVFSLTPEQNFGIQCVLDGTIQVWRPFEYYYPDDDQSILVCTAGDADSVEIPSGAYCELTGGRILSGTHWQPLPQPPQEVIHA